MRVEPQISSVSPTPISLGNGINAPAFNIQTVQTTVLASDGETIVLGGLITKQDQPDRERDPVLQGHPVRRGAVPLPHAPGAAARGADHHDAAHHAERGRPGPHPGRGIREDALVLPRRRPDARARDGSDRAGSRRWKGRSHSERRRVGRPPQYYAPGPAYFGSIAPEGTNPAASRSATGRCCLRRLNRTTRTCRYRPRPRFRPVCPCRFRCRRCRNRGPRCRPAWFRPATPTITPTSMMPGQPGAMMPVMPAGAIQPQTGMSMQPPMAAPAASLSSPAPPLLPAGTPSAPTTGLPRSYQMVYPPKLPTTGNGLPADKTDRKNTDAMEGRQWDPFGR